MAVVTESFDIPMDIMTKLATGPNKGQIVKHLEPVKTEQADQIQKVGSKIMQVAKNRKKELIIGALVTGTITVGGVVYHKIKSRQPEVVQNYHAALRDYIDDVRSGKLSMESINCLMDSLEKFKQNK